MSELLKIRDQLIEKELANKDEATQQAFRETMKLMDKAYSIWHFRGVHQQYKRDLDRIITQNTDSTQKHK